MPLLLHHIASFRVLWYNYSAKNNIIYFGGMPCFAEIAEHSSRITYLSAPTAGPLSRNLRFSRNSRNPRIPSNSSLLPRVHPRLKECTRSHPLRFRLRVSIHRPAGRLQARPRRRTGLIRRIQLRLSSRIRRTEPRQDRSCSAYLAL